MRFAPKHWLVIAAVLTAGALYLRSSVAQPAAKPAAGPTKVAVCDVVEVFKNYKKVDKLNAEFQERERNFKAEEEKRVKMINDLGEELKQLVEGSPEYERGVEDLLRRRYELEGWKKTNEQLLLKWHFNATRQMLQEIQAVIAQIAQERGYDLVLFKEAESYQGANTNQLLEEVAGRRKVLYSSPALDITQDVQAQVNLRYSPGN